MEAFYGFPYNQVKQRKNDRINVNYRKEFAMKIWFDSLMNGIKVYACLMPVLAALELLICKKRNRFNPVTFAFNQFTAMYIICLFSVTLFPLPTAAEAAKLSTYDAQLIPFRFVSDILREKSLRSVAQVIFNVALTVPFGIALKVNGKTTCKKTVAIVLSVSLFIELVQLTGLFFIYNGSYRLFDLDDLMLNSLGGFCGYRMAAALETLLANVTGRRTALAPMVS